MIYETSVFFTPRVTEDLIFDIKIWRLDEDLILTRGLVVSQYLVTDTSENAAD